MRHFLCRFFGGMGVQILEKFTIKFIYCFAIIWENMIFWTFIRDVIFSQGGGGQKKWNVFNQFFPVLIKFEKKKN